MQAYTRDELIALRPACDVPPARPVRKAIFRYRLWQPSHERKQLWWKARRSLNSTYCVRSVVDNQNEPSNRSEERNSLSSIKFGLLNTRSVGNSSIAVATTVTEGQYDVFLLTETWHSTSEDADLRRCVPAGYACIDVHGQQGVLINRITGVWRQLYQTSGTSDISNYRSDQIHLNRWLLLWAHTKLQ